MDPVIVIVVVSIVVTLGFTFSVQHFVKRKLGGSKADHEKIARLQAEGAKARARVTGVKPTGLTLNNHHVQCLVHFQMEPLDGSPPFAAQKKMFFFETQFPRQGDAWPSWYDRADPSTFAVGVPDTLDAAQIPVYREFGIPHPLDTGASPG